MEGTECNLDEPNLLRPETTVELYLGPDMSVRLEAIENDVVELAKTHPAEAAELLVKLKVDFALHDRKWRPWRVCASGECSRECDANSGCRDEVERNEARTRESMVRMRRDFDQVDIHKDQVAEMSPRELRKRATLTVWCSDCRQMVACVLPLGGRDLMVTRSQDGNLEASVWLDGAFWGGVSYCRRKQFALRAGDIAAALVDGVGKVVLQHAQK